MIVRIMKKYAFLAMEFGKNFNINTTILPPESYLRSLFSTNLLSSNENLCVLCAHILTRASSAAKIG